MVAFKATLATAAILVVTYATVKWNAALWAYFDPQTRWVFRGFIGEIGLLIASLMIAAAFFCIIVVPVTSIWMSCYDYFSPLDKSSSRCYCEGMLETPPHEHVERF